MTTTHKNQVGQASKNGGEFAARTHTDSDVTLGNRNRELVKTGTIIINPKSSRAIEADVKTVSPSEEFCVTIEGEKSHTRYRVVHIPSGLAVPAHMYDTLEGRSYMFSAKGFDHANSGSGYFKRVTDAKNYMNAIDNDKVRAGLNDDGVLSGKDNHASFKEALLEQVKASDLSRAA